MKAIITVGLPGSGKTTFFSGHCGVILNRDDVRLEEVGETGMGSYYSAENASVRAGVEKSISDKLSMMANVAAERGMDLVSTDTNINPFFREQLVERLTTLGFSVEYYVFDIPLGVCIERNNQREGWRRVDDRVIQSMHSSFMEAKVAIEAGEVPYRVVNTAGEVS